MIAGTQSLLEIDASHTIPSDLALKKLKSILSLAYNLHFPPCIIFLQNNLWYLTGLTQELVSMILQHKFRIAGQLVDVRLKNAASYIIPYLLPQELRERNLSGCFVIDDDPHYTKVLLRDCPQSWTERDVTQYCKRIKGVSQAVQVCSVKPVFMHNYVYPNGHKIVLVKFQYSNPAELGDILYHPGDWLGDQVVRFIRHSHILLEVDESNPAGPEMVRIQI